MKKIIKKYKIQLKLLFALTIGLVCMAVLFYFLIPMILNYPEGTYATDFQVELENTNYLSQVILISFAIFGIFAIITFFKTNFLVKYNDLLKNPEKYSVKQLNFVKNKLMTVPYSILILNIIIPTVALTVIHAITINQLGITTVKLFVLALSLQTLFVTTIFIYATNLFRKILLKLPHDDTNGLKKSTLKRRLLFNIVPIFFASMLFLSLLGYTKVATETGNSLFETYRESLYYFSEYNTFTSKQDLLNKAQDFRLRSSDHIFFVKDSSGKFVNINNKEIEFSKFFNKYLNEMSPNNNGRVYEYYGVDCQGASYEVNINGETYTIGVYFKILSTNTLIYFAIAYLSMLVINIIILILFAQSLSNEITAISDSFLEMAKKEDESVMDPLPLLSNDEIGKLTISFNKIQQLTQNNIQQIHDNQETLMEKERLASLGQLIGGIAHNLKTPIMSISGAAEGLTDLIKEYDSSIDDPEVNSNDHHDIAKDMSVWVEKIKEYSEYMSDVITAVKGQAVALSTDEDISFTVGELLKRVNILMKHELKNAIIYLNTDVQVEDNLLLKGDVNSLVQVINNMISNSIQAYNGKTEQNIDLIVRREDNNLVISIKDYAGGLPSTVKDKLFKEMVTTKGKNGTGLGLYMSYSTIRAHFNGNITVDTDDANGTTFNIILPL